LNCRQTKEDRENLQESHLKTELLESLQRLPISFGMALTTRDKCKRVASELVGKESLFVLGKGYAEPIALEGEGDKRDGEREMEWEREEKGRWRV
jgi:glutamine---fructose-6-phosphate transaminase (isomerizing)